MTTFRAPAGLPPSGTIVNSTINTWHAPPIAIQYQIKVQYVGVFDYVPSSGGAYYSSPAPNLHYKYQNRVYMKKTSGWVEIPPGNYPWSSKPPATFWSAKTPQQLYGWKPASTLPIDNADARAKALSKATKQAVSSGLLGTSTDPGVQQVAFKKRPSGPLATNPSLHKMSKGIIHWDRTIADSARLGVISLPSQIRSIQNAKYSKNWGFRFLYNPTAYGYSQTSTDGVMPEQVTASRTDLLIPATSSYSIELYLNRIPDMKKSNQSASYYSPRPAAYDLQQLWSRGTEYDLDFLYRVINGDPKTIVGWKKSSNIGALIMQRVLLKMGSGLYVTGVINSINVQHVMFTDNMIPTFTTVTLDFTQWFQEFVK